jgi:uncharacterized membrane protein
MNKMIVAVFDQESAAYKGLSAMNELHAEGSISLYAIGVIAKDGSGNLSIKQAADEGPVGTVIGMATGSLIGLLGGPAGVAIGMSLGGMTGMLADLHNAGIDADYADEVSNALAPGKTAVVAEVEEYWVAPVDTRIEALGGMVFRRHRAEVIDEQYEREAEMLHQEWEQLKEEIRQASADAKSKIDAKIEATKKKLDALHTATKKKIEQFEKEQKAKLDTLQEQMKTASDKQKAKIEKRVAEIKADYEVRSKKLARASELTKEALTAKVSVN